MNGLEQELGDKLHFIHINIQSQVGNDLEPVYNFEYTPTFIFFDAHGTELWREVGGLDAQHVRDSLNHP